MTKTLDFTLAWRRNKAKATVTAEADGNTIHVDTIDPTNAKHRDAFAKALAKLGCDSEDACRDLLSVADEFGRSDEKASSQRPQNAEVDLSDIHRPERFITPGINGLTVPIFLESSTGIIPKWSTYVYTSEKRFTCELSPRLEVDDATLFISPIPTDPNQNNRTGWCQRSRIDWLENSAGVDPAELFRRIVKAIDHFVEFEVGQQKGILATLTCWIVLSYCYQVWPAVPYMFLNGPPESGKSTTFDVLERLCFRVFKTDMPSPSTIFRTLHETGGTFLYDEAERLKQTQADDIGRINAMLLAGYRRGGCADLMEKIGDGFKRTSFQVYGPKAIANINGVPAALQSRCIEITMQKADPDSDKPNRQINNYDFQSIIDDLHVLTLNHGGDWLEMAQRNERVAGLNGRDNELWKPLVSIGRWFDSHGVEGVTDILIRFANDSAKDSKELAVSDIDLTFLSILAEATKIGESMTNKEILKKAKDDDSTTYCRWSPSRVGSRLRAFGLRTEKSGSHRYYRNADKKLRDIQRRHGIDLGFGAD